MSEEVFERPKVLWKNRIVSTVDDFHLKKYWIASAVEIFRRGSRLIQNFDLKLTPFDKKLMIFIFWLSTAD